MLSEEQYYLLIVCGKRAGINLRDCALDSNTAPNLATNPVLCVNEWYFRGNSACSQFLIADHL